MKFKTVARNVIKFEKTLWGKPLKLKKYREKSLILKKIVEEYQEI